MQKVPFFTNDPDTSGAVKLSGESLVFEWERGGVAGFSLELSRVKTIAFQRGLLASGIFIRLREPEDLIRFPVSEKDAAVLKIARRHRDIAEQLVKDVSFSLMDSQLNDMLDLTDL